MIQIALYLTYAVLLLVSSAMLAEVVLRRLGGPRYYFVRDQGLMGSLADSLLVGLMLLTAILAAVSLVQPLTGTFQVVLSGVVFICAAPLAVRAVRKRGRAHLTFPGRALALLMALFIGWGVVIARGGVRVYDTGTYHIQAMRWIKDYGVVPGLANLFPQLGYNSAWHVFCGLLDHGMFGQGRSYHVAGLLVFVYFLAFCMEGYELLAAGRSSPSVFLRLLGFIAITYYYSDFLASLGTDMLAAVLVHHAVVRTSEVMEDRPLGNARDGVSEHQRTLVLVTAVTVFAVTVKLSVLPCLLLPCLIWFRLRDARVRTLLPCLGIALFLGLPFLARNYVLTGYVVYPQTQLDIFHCDWKVPADDVKMMTDYIGEFAICGAHHLDIRAMNAGTKLLTWYTSWRGKRRVPWLLSWAALGLGSCLLTLVGRLKVIGSDWLGNSGVLGVIVAGTVFCLMTAPEPRFLGAWGLALGYSPMAWLASSVADRWVTRPGLRSAGAVAVLFSFWVFLFSPMFTKALGHMVGHGSRAAGDASSLGFQTVVNGSQTGASPPPPGRLTPPGGRFRTLWTVLDVPDVALLDVESAYGVVVSVPAEGNKLWNSPLPCAQRVHPWLQMRGAGLNQGFRATRAAGWACLDVDHCRDSK